MVSPLRRPSRSWRPRRSPWKPGGLTLEQTTRLYEEGLRLARICSELLSAAELRITRIQTSFGEQMRFLAQDDLDHPPADGIADESAPYDAEAP